MSIELYGNLSHTLLHTLQHINMHPTCTHVHKCPFGENGDYKHHSSLSSVQRLYSQNLSITSMYRDGATLSIAMVLKLVYGKVNTKSTT